MKASVFPSLIEVFEVLAGYTLPVDGNALLKPFAPAPQTSGTLNSLVVAAVTPTAASFSLVHETAGGQPPVADDCTLNSWWTQHDGLGTLRYLRVFARRKPGTAGAIVAQTISVYKTSAGGTLLGTITVGAAAAGAEPVSDIFEKEFRNIGITPIGTGANPLFFTCTAADTDLEVVVLALGEN